MFPDLAGIELKSNPTSTSFFMPSIIEIVLESEFVIYFKLCSASISRLFRPSDWYHEACVSLGLKHRLHSYYEKNIVHRLMEEYVKDRTENFDDYYPCKNKPDCNFNHHVYHWFMLLFILMYNLSKLLPNSINCLTGGDKA